MRTSKAIPLWCRLCLLMGGVLVMMLGGSMDQVVCAQERDEEAVADTGRAAVPPAPPDSVEAEDIGAGPSDRAIVEADSLSALVRDGERLQELFDNVKVRQDSTRLRSDFALRYLNRDQLLFTGDVVIYERGDTLWADTVRYNKRTKVGYARSNVRLTDGEVMVRAPRATYYTREKRSVFPDSVTLIDSTRVLRAQSGTYWSNARRAEFQDSVRLTDPETHLTSDSLTYYRDQERSIARGDVAIRRIGRNEEAPTDTTMRTYLFGKWADNQEQNRFSRVEGEALLVRIRMDTTGAPEDTLVVRARRLDAFRADSRRRLIAVDSVRVWEHDLSAVGDSMVYDRVVERDTTDTLATPSPLPGPTAPRRPTASGAPDTTDSTAGVPDTIRARADTTVSTAGAPDTTGARADTTVSTAGVPDTIRARADTTAPAASARDTIRTRADTSTAPRPPPDDSVAADTAQGPTPPDGAAAARPSGLVVRDTSQLPLEETRLFQDPVSWFEDSQVWGDSIRVRARERTPDTVFVRGSAFAAQRDEALDRIQQLKGRTLTAFFQADSLRRIEAEPNARAIRFLKTQQGTLKGGAKASSDRIVLHFQDGTVRRTSIIGGVESTYYRTPAAVPSPFRLDGFQWTPERRPTKDTLLQEPRVRTRLERPVKADSSIAARDRPPPRADSMAERADDTEAQRPPAPDSASPGDPDRTVPTDSLQRAPSLPGSTDSTNPSSSTP